jgi:hypothetical protein
MHYVFMHAVLHTLVYSWTHCFGLQYCQNYVINARRGLYTVLLFNQPKKIITVSTK